VFAYVEPMLALVPGLGMGAVALGLPRDADAVNVAGGACEFDDFLRALVRSATGAVENIESTMVFDEKRVGHGCGWGGGLSPYR